MRRHRFIIDADLRKKSLLLEGDIARQISRVFRASVGDELIICDGKGTEATATIEAISKRDVRVRLIDRSAYPAPAFATTLYCAMLKKTNFELVVQKATECGVTRLIPLLTERVVKSGIRLDRLHEIAREAAEQSGRAWLLEISEPMTLEQAFAESKQHEVNLFYHISGKQYPGAELKKAADIGLFIGPEGGWSKAEVELAGKHGMVSSRLADHVLRAETAAMIAGYLAANRAELF